MVLFVLCYVCVICYGKFTAPFIWCKRKNYPAWAKKYIVSHRAVAYCNAIDYIIMYHIVLYCIASYYIVPCCIVLCCTLPLSYCIIYHKHSLNFCQLKLKIINSKNNSADRFFISAQCPCCLDQNMIPIITFGCSGDGISTPDGMTI